MALPGDGAARAARPAAARAARVAVLALALAASAIALAQAPANPAGPARDAATPDHPRDLPLDEVAAGDRGYGLTEGPDGVARFDVEVVAVQRPTGTGFATVLIRTSGRFLEEVGGVAAGMSGSPVYLGAAGEERLVGALAYAFPDSDHRLALVTPIGAMRALADADDGGPAPPDGAAPLATPLLMSGVGPRAFAHLAPALERAGHAAVPLQAGAAGLEDGAAPEPALEPGAAVAVTLARGDVAIAAIGTVTDVRGDEVLLLGHPLLRSGPVDHALVAADVTAIVRNAELPFKLANLGRDPLARVIRDGRAGLLARLDEVPGGLPVTVRVDAPGGARTVAVRISRDRALAPALLAAVVQEAVDGVRDRVGGGSAELAWEIEFVGEAPIRLLDQRVEDRDLATTVARLAAAPLAVLLDNPFRDPGLSRVSVRVGVDERPRDAEIVEVALETPEVEPGGTVRAFVRVQPYRGEAEVRTLAFEVPDDATPGPLRLTFRGASVPEPDADEAEPPPADPLRQAISGLPPVISWGELLAALENRAQARELLVEVPGATRPRRLAREDLGHVVTGLERVTVRVVDPGGDADGEGDDAERDGADAPEEGDAP